MTDDEIRAEILSRAASRGAATFCPSEVAGALALDWSPLMGRVRRVAAGLPQIVATQKGVPVDPLGARGPIRLGLRQ